MISQMIFLSVKLKDTFIIFVIALLLGISLHAKSAERCENLFLDSSREGLQSSQRRAYIEKTWSKLTNIHLIIDNVKQPSYQRAKNDLVLTLRLAKQVQKELVLKGYETKIVYAKKDRRLNTKVPARWRLEITKAPMSGRMGPMIQNAIDNLDSRFYVDFLGPWRNGTSGSNDYDQGISHITMNRRFYDEPIDGHDMEGEVNYFFTVEHEIHHAKNHMHLKSGIDDGMYAEIEVTNEGKSQGAFLTEEYKNFFNLDEIVAYYEQYRSCGVQYYLRMAQKFIVRSQELTSVALRNLTNPLVVTGTKYHFDRHHNKVWASVPIHSPEGVKLFDYAVWLLDATDIKDREKNEVYLKIALQKLLQRLDEYQRKVQTP